MKDRESFGVPVGESLLYTFQVERSENAPDDKKWLGTLEDRNTIDDTSYFIDYDDEKEVILSTKSYWNNTRNPLHCTFLSLNSIVDTKNM